MFLRGQIKKSSNEKAIRLSPMASIFDWLKNKSSQPINVSVASWKDSFSLNTYVQQTSEVVMTRFPEFGPKRS